MKAIKDLELQLKKIHAPVLNYFRPGLPKNQIIKLFHEIELIPSDELIQLYEWRDGLQYANIAVGKIAFGVNGVFLPLRESILMYKEFTSKQFPSMFPIFWDEMLLIELDSNSKDYQSIFIHSPSLLIIEPMSCYDSLTAMIETFATCLKNGASSYNDDEFFQVNYDMSDQISKTNNPRSEFWNRDTLL